MLSSDFSKELYKNSAGITSVCQGIFVQDDEKYASRLRAKLSGGLCVVLP